MSSEVISTGNTSSVSATNYIYQASTPAGFLVGYHMWVENAIALSTATLTLAWNDGISNWTEQVTVALGLINNKAKAMVPVMLGPNQWLTYQVTLVGLGTYGFDLAFSNFQ